MLATAYFVTSQNLLILLATPPERRRASGLAKLELTSFSPSDYHRLDKFNSVRMGELGIGTQAQDSLRIFSSAKHEEKSPMSGQLL